MKVKDLEQGCVIWYDHTVLGIVGFTLPPIFNECECRQVPGNPFDYNLKKQTYTEEQEKFIFTLEW